MPTYHKHPIYDTDLHLIIDPVSRLIKNESGKTVLMQNDHNSERFTFEVSRYVEGHDMSLCNVVEVHYINVDSNKKMNQNADVYPVVDLQIAPDADDVVVGSWLVSHNATMYAGTLNAIFRFACVDEETSEITYQWFSEIFKDLKVSKGIYNSDVVTQDDDSDVLAAWKKEVWDMTMPLVEEVRGVHANVMESVNAAKSSEENAKASELAAKVSEENAKASELAAKVSEENAKDSEDVASSKADESADSALLSKSYCMGETGIREDEDSNNAKLHCERAGNIADTALEKLDETMTAIRDFEHKLESPMFSINTETGNLEYESSNYTFNVDIETGNLNWEVVT